MEDSQLSGKSWIVFILFGGYALSCFLLTFYLFSSPLTAPSIKNIPKTVTPALIIPKPDFAQFIDVDAKKSAFFSYLLPMVQHENKRISKERQHLTDIDKQLKKDDGKLSYSRLIQLHQLADEYDVDIDSGTPQEIADELFLRIDQIPPAMVLAQAANESAWGTSRFARAGNNFFGQWCFREGCGLVPELQRPGPHYEVAKFKNVNASVHSYFDNINSNHAYRHLRSERATLRKTGTPVTAAKLIPELTSYSERGEAYIDEIQSIISINDLTQYKIPTATEG